MGGKLSLEEIDTRLAERGFERVEEYSGTTRNHHKLIHLECGHEWSPRICEVLKKRGTGCPKCSPFKSKLTAEEVDSRLAERGFERVGEYVGTTQKPQRIKHPECGHEWNPTLNSVFRGTGCPKCAGFRAKLTVEEVDSRLAERGFERVGEYVGTTLKPQRLRDLECGHEWNPTLNSVFGGTGCPKCAESAGFRAKLTVEEVDSRLAERGFERVGEYVGTTKGHQNIRHLKCGYEWSPQLSWVFQGEGGGCPQCGGALRRRLTIEDIDEILSERGFARAGEYVGSTSKPTPVRCLTCKNEWNGRIHHIKRGVGCPSCARDPWLKNGIYHLHHPQFDYQYVGISWKPTVRLTEHQQDDGDRGELARALKVPYEFTFQEVYDVLDIAWEENRLPTYVLNWFEQNPHGKLPSGRLWFVEWDGLSSKELNETARVPRFVAEWVETEMIRLLSINFEADNPYSAAGKVELVNITKNATSA